MCVVGTICIPDGKTNIVRLGSDWGKIGPDVGKPGVESSMCMHIYVGRLCTS